MRRFKSSKDAQFKRGGRTLTILPSAEHPGHIEIDVAHTASVFSVAVTPAEARQIADALTVLADALEGRK